jgi:hypothetical protein
MRMRMGRRGRGRCGLRMFEGEGREVVEVFLFLSSTPVIYTVIRASGAFLLQIGERHMVGRGRSSLALYHRTK